MGSSPPQQYRTEHLKNTLNFIRGGRSAFEAGGKITFYTKSKEPDTSDYINAIASIYRELRKIKPGQPAGQWNDNEGVSKGSDSNIPNWDSSSLWANNSRIRIDIPGI